MNNYAYIILVLKRIILLFVIPVLFWSGSFIKDEPCSKYSQQNVDSILKELHGIDLDYISVIQGLKHQIPLTSYFFENIDEIPNFSESVNTSIVSSKYNSQTLFHYSYQMLSASAGGFGPPLSGTGTKKAINNQNDLTRFFETTGVELIKKEEWEKLPFPFKKGIVEILYSFDEAKMVFDQFSEPIKEYLNAKSAYSTLEIYNELINPWNHKELKEFSSIKLIEQADLKKLSLATRLLTEKLSWFFTQKEMKVPENFTGCSIKSCMGELLISGINNDTIKGGQFFVVELGGDDVYLGNTASSVSIDQPFGIVVDLKGNDKYLCNDNFLVAGILGIGILLDLEGNDYYITEKPGLAFSFYGSSLLFDYSDDDTYVSKSDNSQAAAYVGSAYFIDIAGTDRYFCQSYSQAFGGTSGVGIFYDNSGDDYYNMLSDSSVEANNSQSFIQGAAKGRWAEATDGQSLAGGIGVFIDNSGNDRYIAGSFSQGASYYFGLGIFNDNGGDDEYDAISHSQGYAAHYSLAGFFERIGDDTYNANIDKNKITQIIGGGRDFSAGLFFEYEGNDTYHFGNRSAGIGDINGIGLLCDFAGNDNYILHKNVLNFDSPSLGKEVGLSGNMNTGFKIFQPGDAVHKGIFIDLHGTNVFEE